MSDVQGIPDADRRERPWLGLASYTAEDAALFCGRDEAITELVHLVRTSGLTVVFGHSGTGKTSLLQAGLLPRMKADRFLPIPVRLQFPPEGGRQANTVRRVLERELAANEIDAVALVSPQRPEGEETLWEYFHRHEFWGRKNRLVTPLILFDQFEEIFTVGDDDPTTAAFLTELADLAEGHVPDVLTRYLEQHELALRIPYAEQNYHVVLGIREDFVPNLDELRAAMPSVMRARFRLRPMTGTEALSAVLGPGAHLIDESVARALVRFVAGRSPGSRPDADLAALKVEPALLSTVCRALNEQRIARNQAMLTLADVEAAHQGILEAFYEQTFAGLAGNARVFVEDRLLTPSGFRSTVAVDEAARAGVSREALGALVDRRLLRVEERLGIPHLELMHDVLTAVCHQSREKRQRREEHERLDAERRTQRIRARWRTLWTALTTAIALVATLQWHNAQVSAKLMRGFLAGLFELTDPTSAPYGSQRLQLRIATRWSEQEHLVAGDDAERRLGAATALDRVGELTIETGSREKGLQMLESAMAELKPLAVERDVRVRTLIGRIDLALASVWDARGDFSRVRAAAKEGIDDLLPVAQEETAKPILADLETYEGTALENNQDAAAAKLQDSAIALYDQYDKAAPPGNPKQILGLANALYSKGARLAWRNQASEASPTLERALATVNRLLPDNEGSEAAYLRGRILRRQAIVEAELHGESDEHRHILYEALRQFRDVVRKNPDVTRFRRALAVTLSDLATASQKRSLLTTAELAFTETATQYARLIERDPGELAHVSARVEALLSLGNVYMDANLEDNVLHVMDKLLPDVEHLSAVEPRADNRVYDIARVHILRSWAYQAKKQYEQAIDSSNTAVALLARAAELDVTEALYKEQEDGVLRRKASCARELGRWNDVVDALRQAVALRDALTAAKPNDTGCAGERLQRRQELAEAYLSAGALGDARREIDAAVDIAKTALRLRDYNWFARNRLIEAQRVLARVLYAQGQRGDAVSALQEASAETKVEFGYDPFKGVSSTDPDRLQKAFDSSSSMKKFTLPCGNDKTRSVDAYISNSVPDPLMTGPGGAKWSPLAEQARLSLEDQQCAITDDVLTAFTKLFTIAQANHVGFGPLVTFALRAEKDALGTINLVLAASRAAAIGEVAATSSPAAAESLMVKGDPAERCRQGLKDEEKAMKEGSLSSKYTPLVAIAKRVLHAALRRCGGDPSGARNELTEARATLEGKSPPEPRGSDPLEREREVQLQKLVLSTLYLVLARSQLDAGSDWQTPYGLLQIHDAMSCALLDANIDLGVRESTEIGLSESRTFIDRLAKEHGLVVANQCTGTTLASMFEGD